MKRVLYILIGAAFGLLIVRGFFLGPAEEIGWRLFWEAVFKGYIGMQGFREVIGSAIFAKSMLGVGVGAVAGYMASISIKPRKRR